MAAQLAAFGSDPVPVEAWVLPRSDRWRFLGAARAAILGIALAPVVFLVPPHVPWALAALTTGVLLASRRLKERYTLLALNGTCPRCGGPITVTRPSRLKTTHTLPCPGCQHETVLTVDVSGLPSASR